MIKNNDKPRTLPPGVQQIDEDITFGQMWIQIGTLKLIRTTNALFNVICQFWGEQSAAVLETRSDLSNNEAKRTQKYDIKCPAPYFKEYLEKMKQNLRLQVEGAGKVDLNMSKFLKQQVKIESQYVFQHFKGFFQIIGRGGRKAGSLEIQMGCQFYPEIALRELGQSLNEGQVCPLSEKKKIEACEGDCACHEQNKEDKRIAHSLENKSPDEKQFKAEKYVEESREEKQFPQIPQILTYSNLQLNIKQTIDEKDQEENQVKKEGQVLDESQTVQVPEKIEQILKKQSKKEEKIQKQIGESLEPSYHIEAKPQSNQKELFNQFYGYQNTPIKNVSEEMEEIKVSPIHKPKIIQNKLLQNVNLTEQLCKAPVPQYTGQLQMKKQKTFNKTKKASLLLNLLIEIKTNSIRVPTQNKILIIHKPYGQNERVTLGPNFEEIITILCPVGQNELRKMDKLPFIIEIWDAFSQKLLGIMKLSLTKIKKGFMIQNQLNEIAIKTNLFPTIIHKGEFNITDIGGKKVGYCDIHAAIGTSSQLDTHFNQTNPWKTTTLPEKQLPSPQKSVHQEKEQKSQKKEESGKKQTKKQKSLKHNLNDFLLKFDAQSHVVVKELPQILKKQELTEEQFEKVGQFIRFDGNQEKLWAMFEKMGGIQKLMRMEDLSSSFNSFKEVAEKIELQYDKVSKQVRPFLKEITELEKNIIKESYFGIIQKQKMFEFLRSSLKKGGEKALSKYEQFFDANVNIDLIISTLTKKTCSYGKIYQYLNENYYEETIIEGLRKRIEKNMSQMLRELNRNQLTIYELRDYLSRKKIQNSLWGILYLVGKINREYGQVDEEKVILENLVNWMNRSKKEKEEIQEYSQDKERKSQIKSEKQEQEKEKSQISQVPSEKQNIEPSNNVHSEQVEKEKQPPVYRHLFTIDAVQLFLQNPKKGTCCVSYTFPFEEDRVRSKHLLLLNDKHKYPLKLFGTHGFSISDSLQNYLGDNTIKFYITVDEKIEYEGALHTDELEIGQNRQEVKVIPIFSGTSDYMEGKIKIRVSYEKKLNSDHTLGKQTTYQLFLPKSGYINYNLVTQIDILKLRNQLNISEEFYVNLTLDIFNNASNLKTHFPPISSKLFSDFSNPLSLSGSLKLTLSSVILDYIKAKSAFLKLNIVYYAKQRANFERREVTYGTIELPLINLIKNEGIQGQYAFKNKLGMFITLANCKLKYERQAYVAEEKKMLSTHHHLKQEQFWIILHFLQFISFETSKINWVRFEFIFKGKKYSTEKCYLHNEKSRLKNSSIVLHLSEEDFFDSKILAVNVSTNLSQKLAIDINLKSVAKKLAKEKYNISNQYFVVVNEQSQPMKIRVGLKLYTFRGTSMLTNFVDVLSRHLDIETFEEIQIPKEINNYERMLLIWKNKLKISSKMLDDTLSELLLNKKKDKLNINFFTCQTQFKLDFTPILIEEDLYPEAICQQLPTEIKGEELMNFLRENSIKLLNFRQQFLSRYSFKELNKNKIDKNIEFLGLFDEVDLIVFMKKLKFHQQEQMMNESYSGFEKAQKVFEIAQIKGFSLHLLYNGIKPNSVVRFPQLQFQTEIIIRSSTPTYQKKYQSNQVNLHSLKKTNIEVYHAPSEENPDEDILIGEGVVNFAEAQSRNGLKVHKVTINSTMSGRMIAELQIRAGFVELQNVEEASEEKEFGNESQLYSRQGSRIGEMLEELNHEMGRKKMLFMDSDEDY